MIVESKSNATKLISKKFTKTDMNKMSQGGYNTNKNWVGSGRDWFREQFKSRRSGFFELGIFGWVQGPRYKIQERSGCIGENQGIR